MNFSCPTIFSNSKNKPLLFPMVVSLLRLFCLPAIAFSLLTPIDAQAAVRIRLGTLAPKGSSYYNELAKMGSTWKKETRGKVSLTIYPDGRMGGEAEMVRRVRVGQLQGGLFSAVGLTEIEPAVSGLQNVPMLFESLDEVDYVGKKLQPLLEDQLQKKGFKVLFWANAGWVYFFTKAPVSVPDDLRKLKIFTWAGSPKVVDVYKGAGMNPVPLETKDILPGLQTGLISAVNMPPVIANVNQIDTKAPFMLDLQWAPLVGAAVIATKAWNRLPSETQTIILKVAHETGENIQRIGRAEADQAVAAMKKRGLKVTQISDEQRAAWQQVAQDVYPQIRGDIVPEDTFDSVQKWISEYRQK